MADDVRCMEEGLSLALSRLWYCIHLNRNNGNHVHDLQSTADVACGNPFCRCFVYDFASGRMLAETRAQTLVSVH